MCPGGFFSAAPALEEPRHLAHPGPESFQEHNKHSRSLVGARRRSLRGPGAPGQEQIVTGFEEAQRAADALAEPLGSLATPPR